MPVPCQTGRWRHYVLNMSVFLSIRLSFNKLVNAIFWKQTVLMAVGRNDGGGKGVKRSALGITRERSRSHEYWSCNESRNRSKCWLCRYMIEKQLMDLGMKSALINIPVNASLLPAGRQLSQPPWSLWWLSLSSAYYLYLYLYLYDDGLISRALNAHVGPEFVESVLKRIDRWCIHNMLRKIVPGVNDALTEEVFPNV